MNNRQLKLNGRSITDSGACYVIAEIGHNHKGDLEICRQMFQSAAECGADAVKLQKRDNRALYTKAMYDSPYHSEAAYGPTYGTHREALEFGRDEYLELKDLAAELGIDFWSTAFDLPSVDFLAEIGLTGIKIASGDLRSLPLLEYAAGAGLPLILSTGGGTMADVEKAVETITPISPNLAVLQCTAAYPVEPEEMNLKVIETFRERFPELIIGLSDHQNGIAMSLIGYVLGARIIEKHFTLNRAWKGSDQAFSLEPGGLRRLVRDLARAPQALGDGVKRVLPNEEGPIRKMGKKLVAAKDLPAGTILEAGDIVMKSPNDGLAPGFLPELIGRRLNRAVSEDENLAFDLLDGE